MKKNRMYALMLVVIFLLSGFLLAQPNSKDASLVNPIGSDNTNELMIAPTPASVLLPKITLTKGEFYFRIDGKPTFVFSRNLAGFTPNDFAVLLTKTYEAGDVFIRVDTGHDAMGGIKGFGYTKEGAIREDWAKNWEIFFEIAESKGVYVLPTFSGGVYWNSNPNIKWQYNPFNSANGGPTKNPVDILLKDSPTQLLYLKWFKDVVTRWSNHKNILAWEMFTEINLMNGVTESSAIYLAEQLAKVVRENDPLKRPVTASLADTGNWPRFLQSTAIDYINIHPYPVDGRLDRRILAGVLSILEKNKKPVLIGESGLSFLPPDTKPATLDAAERADVGIRHAIWAALVSGAMNGRALWWQDGFGIFFPSAGWSFVNRYEDIESPAVKFINKVDFSDFKPLKTASTSGIIGAAIGNEKSVIGWFRDAKCEPPDWKTQTVITRQTVTITVPGSVPAWRVDFYKTKNGTDILQTATVTRKGDKISITLPDFQDDLAFKMYPIQ
jgi:hypothetical protein